MSDNSRREAIVERVRAVYPDALIRFGSRGWVYDGKGVEILVIDYSNQDIGGEPLERAVQFSPMDMESFDSGFGYKLYKSEWISDEDLPKPTLKPRSQAVNLSRVIHGIDQAQRYS